MPPSGASLNCWTWSVKRVVFYKDTYIILLHPKLGTSF